MSSSARIADLNSPDSESERCSPDNTPLIKRRRVLRDEVENNNSSALPTSDCSVSTLSRGGSAMALPTSSDRSLEKGESGPGLRRSGDSRCDDAGPSRSYQDFGPSWSSEESLADMMDFLNPSCDISYYLPCPEDRPWRAPLGCISLYESYFRECGLRFPIPRFVQSFCRRREVAISQLSVGSIRNMAGLKILADRCGVRVTARLLEELVSFKEQKGQPGVFYTSAVRKYPLATGFDRKTRAWNRSFFFVKIDEGSVEDPSVSCYTRWQLDYGRSPK